MQSPRRVLALLTAALAVAGASGCGGDAEAKNDYVDAVTSAQRDYASQFDQVRQRLTATSTASQDRQALGSFVTATQRFVTDLRAIDPPDAVKREHGELVATLVGYERQVQTAAKRIAGGSTADRARVRTDLSSGVDATQRKLQDAIADINKGLRD